jgi:hypothetical protein
MATLLKKTVTRELDRPGPQGRKLLVSLEPGDIISMREKGRHMSYSGSLERVYYMLVRIHADELMRQQKQEKMMKKEGLA